jgi:hypothetical protein
MNASSRLLCLVGTLNLLACSDEVATRDSSGSSTDTSADAGADTGTGEDTGTGAGDDTGGEQAFELAPGECFTLETGTVAASDGMPCGDFMALAGLNVDLMSATGLDGAGGFCDRGGPYASIDEVPTGAGDCLWTAYVEGLERLDGRGFLVRNAAQTQTWVIYIITNAQPAMQFVYRPLSAN